MALRCINSFVCGLLSRYPHSHWAAVDKLKLPHEGHFITEKHSTDQRFGFGSRFPRHSLVDRLRLAGLADGFCIGQALADNLMDAEIKTLCIGMEKFWSLLASSGDHAGALALVHVAGFAADEGFVYFDFAGDFAACLALLCKSDPMQKEPCGLLGDAKRPRNFTTADAILAVQNHPGCRKPFIQADGGVLHDGSNFDRELPLGVPVATLPAQLIFKEANLEASTLRAYRSILPFGAALHEVRQAVLGIREIYDSFLKGLGFVTGFHTSSLPQKRVLVKYICALCSADRRILPPVLFGRVPAHRRQESIRVREIGGLPTAGV